MLSQFRPLTDFYTLADKILLPDEVTVLMDQIGEAVMSTGTKYR